MSFIEDTFMLKYSFKTSDSFPTNNILGLTSWFSFIFSHSHYNSFMFYVIFGFQMEELIILLLSSWKLWETFIQKANKCEYLPLVFPLFQFRFQVAIKFWRNKNINQMKKFAHNYWLKLCPSFSKRSNCYENKKPF